MTGRDLSSSASVDAAATAGPSTSVLPPILPISSFPPTGTPIHDKPSGYDFYRNVLHSPKHIVAPMVAGSELPWRIFSRRLGADLCYSPMINSNAFTLVHRAGGKNAKAKALRWFNSEAKEEGQGQDNMLIVQLAGHDPEILLEAARHVEDYCLAIDLNLGCPQGIAKRGRYGSWLQEDWPLIFSLINILHLNLKIPVTAKMRVFPDVERTVAYARMLEHAGAQIITVHGRTREQKGHKSGLADWKKIKAVKEAVKVPVFCNGNVLYTEDIEEAMRLTGADGVMSAEGNLYTPSIFASKELRESIEGAGDLFPHGPSGSHPRTEWAQFPLATTIADEYLDEVVRCKTYTDNTAVKSHLFKICRTAVERHTDVRNMIGRAGLRWTDEPDAEKGEDGGKEARERVVKAYRDAIRLLDEKLKEDMANPEFYDPPSPSPPALSPEQRYIPHWLCQPYFRPKLPDTGNHNGNSSRKKDDTDADSPAIKEAGGMIDTNDVQSKGEKRVMEGEEEDDMTKKARLQEQLLEAQTLKDRGNTLFAQKDYHSAVTSYGDAISTLPTRKVLVEEEVEEEQEEENDVPEAVSDIDTKRDWADEIPSYQDQGDRRPAQASSSKTKSGAASKSTRSEPVPAAASNDKVRELTDDEVAALSTPVEPEVEELRSLEISLTSLRQTCYSNLSLCYLKLQDWSKAKDAAEDVLEEDPNHLKALHRASQACEGLYGDLKRERKTVSQEEGASNKAKKTSSYGKTIPLLETHLSHLSVLLSLPSLPPDLKQPLTSLQSRTQSSLKAEQELQKEEMMGQLKEVGDKVLGWFGLSTNNFKFEKNGKGGGYGMKFQR